MKLKPTGEKYIKNKKGVELKILIKVNDFK